jgi:S1-C subfamily serine protease
VIGMVIASSLGVALRSRVRGRSATVVDSMGGAVVNVVAVMLVAWLIGSFVAYSPFPAISSEVNNSLVLKTVDKLVPRGTLTLPSFRPLHSLLASGPYTQVFSALGAESALTLRQPDPAVLNSPGLQRAKDSIVKVQGVAPSCSKQIEGSGFVISPEHILTNAHVVAGVTEGPYVSTLQHPHRNLLAKVVLYDPNRDLAVLYVPGLAAPALQFNFDASYGQSAIVAGYPFNHPFTVDPARIATAESAVGPNIYQTAQVKRQIYPIKALVRPGNSGGPLLSPGGRVYGVVFAAAVSLKQTGYALTASEVATDVIHGQQASRQVSTDQCQS